jgi:hypothetical protein
LQSRSDTAHQLAVSIMTVHRIEQRCLLRTVKLAGDKGKVFHIVDEVKQLIESRARGNGQAPAVTAPAPLQRREPPLLRRGD